MSATATVIPQRSAAPAERAVLWLFTATTFLAAALLFLVQPLVTRMLLPRLGGAPAVWNTAMVFFQVVLLAGYAWSHLSGRFGRRQPLAQLALLALPLLTLPLALPDWDEAPSGASVSVWVLAALAVTVGAPFLALSTSSPALQRWFAATDHPAAADPYFLYAAGNTGSLLALLGYPLVVEPRLDLDAQVRLWSAGYVAVLVLSAACAVVRSRRLRPAVDPTGAPAAASSPRPTARQRAGWVALAAVPSALLLGVTRHVATDVAAVPLLWVVPLSLYLLTFIVAFSGERRSRWAVAAAAPALRLLILPLALLAVAAVGPPWAAIGLHLLAFLAAATVAHGRLAAARPAADRLTDFYLWVAVGGVVGGASTALVAPLVFDRVLEYPLALVASVALLPALRRGPRTALAPVAFAVAVAGAALVLSTGTDGAARLAVVLLAAAGVLAHLRAANPAVFAVAVAALLAVPLVEPDDTLLAERTFFGVHRVSREGDHHVFVNGTTLHGLQAVEGDLAGEPLAYYARSGPAGQVFEALGRRRPRQDVGVVGLGTGALSAYGRTGDRLTYYEIDQAVVDLATDPALFTFVDDSRAEVDVVLGDGRLALDRPSPDGTDRRHDLLVLDAFSSDAIPVHLLTREAFAVYRRHLADGGALLVHISNRYFDLAPAVAALAADAGLGARLHDFTPSTEDAADGVTPSTWALLAVDPDVLDELAGGPGWAALVADPDDRVWTDSYADVLGALRW